MNKNSINKQTYTKMNKKSLFVLGFSAALLAGCSSDNVVPNGGDGDLSGDAYVSISLHLPTTSGLRSDNDVYDQGDDEEWTVANATAIYFDENEQFIDAKNLTQESDSDHTPSDGITTEITYTTQKVDRRVAKVLVILNSSNANFNIADLKNGDFKSFNHVYERMASNFYQTDGGVRKNFFMSNSPLSDGTVLVTVHPQRTEEDAKKKEYRANVYVERAVAKVSVAGVDASSKAAKGTWTDWTYTLPQDDDNIAQVRRGDEVKFESWALDVTNKKTFLVRKFNMTDVEGKPSLNWKHSSYNGRNISAAPLYTAGPSRTYWAEDPNYSNAFNTGDFEYSVGTTLTNPVSLGKHSNGNLDGGKDYCLENTFDVDHMNKRETTRIIFKATYKPNGADFTQGATWYLLGNSNTPFSVEGLKNLIKSAATTIEDVQLSSEAGSDKDVNDVIKVKHAGDVNFVAMSSDEKTSVEKALGTTKITTYSNGVCYYVARIKHFGDELTPWDGTDYKTATDENRYNFLGRYGVVRNNWYQMTLNTVSGPGTPTIPDTPDEIDDDQYYYLQTTVKIMDWAVRKQSLDF